MIVLTEMLFRSVEVNLESDVNDKGKEMMMAKSAICLARINSDATMISSVIGGLENLSKETHVKCDSSLQDDDSFNRDGPIADKCQR